MATIEKRVGRRSVSYRITVSDGYDGNYKKIRHRKTWRVPEGWSEKKGGEGGAEDRTRVRAENPPGL